MDQGDFFRLSQLRSAIPPLRDYQTAALEELRDGLRQGIKSQMLCSPTGSGKTVIAAELCRLALMKGSRVWFICDREILVEQTSDEFRRFGLPHGVTMGSRSYGRARPLQVCSAQTLMRRSDMPLPDLAIVDEAHVQFRALLRRFLDNTRPVPLVGLSATPFTTGLGRYYRRVVAVRPTNKLVEENWLAPLKVFVPDKIVDGRVLEKNRMGEFTDASAAKASMRITGDILEDWSRLCHQEFGRLVKTLIFAATIPHAEHLSRAFADMGHDFRLYIQSTPPDERRRALAALKEGRAQGMISVEAASRGFDQRDIECVIMARPYAKSLAQVIQQMGRGQRTADGKEKCIVLDSASNFLRMWEPIYDFWERGAPLALDMGSKNKSKMRQRSRGELECRECGAVKPPGTKVCPHCGAVQRPRPLDVEVASGDLTAFDPSAALPERRERHELDAEALAAPWPHLCAMAKERLQRGKYQDKADPHQAAVSWARVQFKQLTGKWPNRLCDNLSAGESTKPNGAVVYAVRKQMKAWIKAQQAA